MTCDACSAAAVVILPGTEEDRHGLFLLARGTPLRAFCERCAREAGWPAWIRSESRHVSG
jgi:hypothetical protein